MQAVPMHGDSASALTKPLRLPRSARYRAELGHFADFRSLLKALRDGHPGACRAVFHAYAPGVVSFASSRGVEDAEALASDVVMAAISGAMRFHGTENNFTSYVFKIARNKIADDLRRQSRRPKSSGTTVDASTIDLDLAAEGASKERLTAILNTLTDTQRDVVIMHVLLGMTHAEVGKVIGKRAGAVRALHHRAMVALRELLS